MMNEVWTAENRSAAEDLRERAFDLNVEPLDLAVMVLAQLSRQVEALKKLGAKLDCYTADRITECAACGSAARLSHIYWCDRCKGDVKVIQPERPYNGAGKCYECGLEHPVDRQPEPHESCPRCGAHDQATHHPACQERDGTPIPLDDETVRRIVQRCTDPADGMF